MNEALKRAARVEQLDKADGVLPAPWYLSEHDGRVMSDGCIPKKEVGDIDFSAENEAAMLECRNVAPALAADMRAYDAALRELVEAWQDVDAKQDASHGGLREAQRRFDRAIEAAKKVLNG